MRKVLISGIVLMAVGLLVLVATPFTVAAFLAHGTQDPLAVNAVSILTAILQQAALPLGAVLIGTGILGLHLDTRLTEHGAVERPHRVYLGPKESAPAERRAERDLRR